jgi:predicted lipoprotein with Yx(FWY)xxD motif
MATRKILHLGSGGGGRQMSSGPARRRMLLVLPAAAAAAALAACGSSGTSASAPASGSSTPSASASASASAAAAAVGLKTAKVGSTTVLTNAKGLTLYSFAPDTSTKSVCNGACATSWPPQPATTSAVKGSFATIKRSDGATQLTFHGHPLYTFVGDKAPGQASGNGVNAFGGVWHEAPATGKAPAGTTPSNNGGYGY